jgi:hypothetical protein
VSHIEHLENMARSLKELEDLTNPIVKRKLLATFQAAKVEQDAVESKKSRRNEVYKRVLAELRFAEVDPLMGYGDLAEKITDSIWHVVKDDIQKES